jgi:hypothetical protein
LVGAAAAPSERPAFNLANKAATAIVEVYAVPRGGDGWGSNLLDGAEIAPGATRAFTLGASGNCSYDLRVVFADKRSRERKGTNLCRRPELPVQ